MYPIANKLKFPNKYIELKYKDNYILINCDNCKTCFMTKKEYLLFSEISKLKKNSCSSIKDAIDNDNKLYNYALKLVTKGIIYLKECSKDNILIHTQPISAYIGLTDNCNFKCSYCYAHCDKSIEAEYESELCLNEYKIIIDKIVERGFGEIVLTGGEPLLNKYVFKIAEYIKEKGVICGILTNGSLIKNFDIELFKIFDYIKISLDSHIEEHNDAVRGKGSYNKILEGIKILFDNNINVDIGSVLTKYNKNDLNSFIEYLDDKFNVKTHIIANYIPLNRDDDLGCSFNELEMCDQVIYETKNKLAKGGINSIIQDKFFPEGKKVFCGMGLSEVFINKLGNIYPCRMTYNEQYLLGNILIDDFKSITHKMLDVNNGISVDNIKGCIDCDYKYLCGGGCRMYHKSYSGSIYINYPPICEQIKREIRNLIFYKHKVYTLE